MHVTMILEDTTISVTYLRNTPPAEGGEADNPTYSWRGTVSDQLTGKSAPVKWTGLQYMAITALATGLGEDFLDKPEHHVAITDLYRIAEEAIKDLPRELRPIP